MDGNVEAIFDAARQLTCPSARTSFLDEACGDDRDLRQQLDALLESKERADQLFEPGAAAMRVVSAWAASDTVVVQPDGSTGEMPGDRIGRYHLIEKLGEGGCGVVFVAEQEEPVRRQVALKVIKAGMDTRAVIARFEAERQAVAIMDHPNIARVFDGGATQAGRPFFVMELVRGVRLTEYCDDRRLSPIERLELFIQVCHAIQHAHQKGVIHRDIKPSNILVSLTDAGAVPKVIDFGIAKAISEKLTETTLLTAFGQFMGTPAYMSPEQARGATEDVDTRTDIYSLGVLLYELLTGETPFDPGPLLQHGIDEMRRVIREQEPERPSLRMRTLSPVEMSAVADRRNTDASRLVQWLRGDLDWIVMKCLEKDRSRRYDTANALAADLRRFLENEPVLARPPSASYRWGKFVRRHRRATAAAAVLFLTVVSGAVISTTALIREHAARARADQRLRAALGFVDQVFTNLSPEIDHLVGATRTQEKLAASGLEFIRQLHAGAGDDPDFPLVLARLYLGLSQVQGNFSVANTLGDFEAALPNALEAIGLLRAANPAYRPDERLDLLQRAELQAAMALLGQGRVQEAYERYPEINRRLDELERFPRFADKARHQRMVAKKNEGALLIRLGRVREAIEQKFLPLLESDWARSVTTNSDLRDLELLSNLHGTLGFAYESAGEFESAIGPAAEAVRLRQLVVARDPNHGLQVEYLAILHTFLGYPLVRLGRAREGFDEFARAREIVDGLKGRDAANHKFEMLRIQVASREASAWAVWAAAPQTPPDERSRRVAEASKHLAEAELVAGKMKTRPLSVDARTFLERARSDVAGGNAGRPQ